ncbi:acetyl-CoA synthetase-like protein [Amanita rubescens]|nr:acetyl-CoA synthetase-like protein [Amanita rubescens]
MSCLLSRIPHVQSRICRRLLTLSAVQGPTKPPLDLRTLPEYFYSEILEHNSERPALICRAEKPLGHGGPPSRSMGVKRHLTWDFDQFERHIISLARGLVAMGVRKGDRVGVIMGNNSSYAMLQWACASLGAMLVTINPAYRLQELVSTLNLVSVKHLVVVPRIRTSAYLSIFSDAFPALRNSAPPDIHSAIDWREIMIWHDGTEGRAVRSMMKAVDKDDVINLQFSSGTTGLPKAVSLTHTNLINNAISISKCMKLTRNDVVCNVPPLFHCFDKYWNLAAWSQSACIVYPSAVYDPPSIVEAIQDERCTALHGVPTHFIGVLAEIAKRRKRLRTGIAAGAPIPIDLMKRLTREMGLTELTNAYGMTDVERRSPVSFQTTYEDPVEKRVETVGRVQPHVKAKVVDPSGTVVPVGIPGEVCVAGYLLQKGYWEDAEQTEKAMKKDEEGTLWMHTGDEGIMDEDGYLRSEFQDVIIRGGENLFPVQIENVLTAEEGVLEAAAVAVPDDKYGEVVGAWIVRRPGDAGGALTREAVRRAVTERMNPQTAPAWVWFVGEDGAQDELPKTASGKVQKHILREWSRDLAKEGVGRLH